MVVYMNAIKDLMDDIAPKFGWRYSPCGYYGDTLPSARGFISDPIVLASYAKAEMAKRGWFMVIGDNIGIYHGTERAFIAASQYDDSDPISEASAILCVIRDALMGPRRAVS